MTCRGSVTCRRRGGEIGGGRHPAHQFRGGLNWFRDGSSECSSAGLPEHDLACLPLQRANLDDSIEPMLLAARQNSNVHSLAKHDAVYAPPLRQACA